MDRIDRLQGHVEALEQQTAHLKHQTQALEAYTHTVERRLRWWRGIACGVLVLGLLSWALPSNQAPDASAAKKRHEDNDHKNNNVEERLAALEDKLTAFSFDDANNEVVITGANLRIVNGLGTTETTNGLGNLIVGYNESRPLSDLPADIGGPPDVHTGSHNIVVGRGLNFSSFGGLVVGLDNQISGEFSSVSGGTLSTASGDFASVSGGVENRASGRSSSVSGGLFNTASVIFASVSGGNANRASGTTSSVSGGAENRASGEAASSVSGGLFNTASGIFASVSGGLNRTAPAENNWAAGALFSDQ